MSTPRKAESDIATVRKALATTYLERALAYADVMNGDGPALLKRHELKTILDAPAKWLRGALGALEQMAVEFPTFGPIRWEIDAVRLLLGEPVTVSTLQMDLPVLRALGLAPKRPGPAPVLRITADSIVAV